MYNDIRLKINRFFRKSWKILLLALCVWIIIFIINKLLKNYEPETELQTTYEPHTSVMNTKDSVSMKVGNSIEELINQYATYCNNAEWDKAFNMLSDSCKKYSFNNDIEEFMKYVYTKMPTEKKYAIQDYSNDGNLYIYQIKYTDDLLATGLTNTVYQYTEEKMIFKKKSNGTIEMAVGNFIDYGEIKNISENEYLKIDVKSVIKYYSMEMYTVKFTNRSDYTIVISDKQESNEAVLSLKSKDLREQIDSDNDIILLPNESKTISLEFQKFYDNQDDADELKFNSIRVMEHYSGTENISEEIIQSEIQNAIAKFSVTIPVTYKD